MIGSQGFFDAKSFGAVKNKKISPGEEWNCRTGFVQQADKIVACIAITI